MLIDKENIQTKVENLITENKKVLKITGYVIGGVGAVYLLGMLFKIIASSVRGFNDFKNSIHGK